MHILLLPNCISSMHLFLLSSLFFSSNLFFSLYFNFQHLLISWLGFLQYLQNLLNYSYLVSVFIPWPLFKFLRIGYSYSLFLSFFMKLIFVILWFIIPECTIIIFGVFSSSIAFKTASSNIFLQHTLNINLINYEMAAMNPLSRELEPFVLLY